DTHRLMVLQRHLNDGGKLLVLLVFKADIAGIDAVLVECLSAAGMIGKKLVADVMKIADQRHHDAKLVESFLDARYRLSRLVAITSDAHEFGAGRGQRSNLLCGGLDIGSVCIGHRLHDNRRAATNSDAPDLYCDSSVPLRVCIHRLFPHEPVPDKYSRIPQVKVPAMTVMLGPFNQHAASSRLAIIA